MSIDFRLSRRDALALMGAAGVAAALPAAARAEGLLLGEQVQGDPEAPVTVIEYASLTCPHCASFHMQVYPDLKREYIDTGKVKMILREVYFDRMGLWGAMVARCEGGSRYFGFIDHMMRTQRDWTQAPDAMAAFKQIGLVGGLSGEQVEACLNDQDSAKALVEQYQAYRNDEPRLTGTPTLIVTDGDFDEKVENPTFANLKAAIDPLL